MVVDLYDAESVLVSATYLVKAHWKGSTAVSGAAVTEGLCLVDMSQGQIVQAGILDLIGGNGAIMRQCESDKRAPKRN